MRHFALFKAAVSEQQQKRCIKEYGMIQTCRKVVRVYMTDRHILSERQLSLRPADLITTLQASRSGTFLWRKNVVNQCLEFASTTDLCIGGADDSPVKTTSTTDLCIGSTNTMETTHPRTCQHPTCVLAVQTAVNRPPPPPHVNTCQHLTCVLAVQTVVSYLPDTSAHSNTWPVHRRYRQQPR